MTIMNYDLETLVRADHELRKISRVVDFGKIARKLRGIKNRAWGKGLVS